jgi:hypothetical protein
MILKRMVILCSLSTLMGGCSEFFKAPVRYASLLPTRLTSKIPDVVIPGTLLARSSGRYISAVDPSAELQRTASEKVDHANRANSRAQTTTRKAIRLEPESTASLDNSSNHASRRATDNHGNPANMDRLVKAGQAAAKPICSGC